MPRCDIAIIGPYIRHNFGDDLIGAVFAKHLESRRAKCCIPGLAAPNAGWLGTVYSKSPLGAVWGSRAVVVGGGGILGDSGRSPKTTYLSRGVRAATLAHWTRKKTVVTGVGAGPLKLPESVRLCRSLCGLAELVGVRDENSREFLQSSIGVPPKKIVAGTDVALVWPKLLPIVPIRNGLIGVQCDAIGFASPQAKPMVDYLYGKLAQWCTDHRQQIALISNSRNDSSLAKRMLAIHPRLNYSQLASFLPHLAGLRCIITTHLHLSIAAFAARVPCYSIFVREKTARFYQQIARPERAVSIETATPDDIDRILDDAEAAQWSEQDERALLSTYRGAEDLLCVLDSLVTGSQA